MERYGLLICDDERMIRERIAGIASRMGCFDVRCAAGGLEALGIVEREEVDGIVLDVCMPEMDGISFLKRLRTLKHEAIVAILSAHDTFDYAQQSLRCGAVEYLLKPVTEAQIVKFLQDLRERIGRRREYSERLESYNQRLDSIRPILKERFFRDLLQNTLDAAAVADMEALLGLRITHPCLVVAVLRIRAREAQPFDDGNPLRTYALGDMLEATLRKSVDACLFHSQNSEMAVIAGGAERTVPDHLAKALEGALAELGDNLNLCFSVGIGNVVGTPGEIRDSYANAIYALNYDETGERVGMIRIDDIANARERADGRHALRSALRNLLQSIPFASSPDAIDRLKAFLEQLRRRNDVGLDDAIYYCSSVCSAALDLLEDLRSYPGRNPLFAIASGKSPEGIYDDTASLLATVVAIIGEKKQGRFRRLADACRDYIDRAYMEKIGLTEIAAQLMVSPNYLSTVFKRETGYNVIEYLNAVRMHNAKRLLRDPAIKIYEIAEKVGFSDTYYFSNVFKKSTGVSPSTYREERM